MCQVVAVEEFFKAYKTSSTRAVTTARTISVRHGWRRKSALLDIPLEGANAFDLAINAADFPTVQALFDGLCEQSPNEPRIQLPQIDTLSTEVKLPEELNRRLIGDSLSSRFAFFGSNFP